MEPMIRFPIPPPQIRITHDFLSTINTHTTRPNEVKRTRRYNSRTPSQRSVLRSLMPGFPPFSSCVLILVQSQNNSTSKKGGMNGRPFCECFALDVLPSRIKESALPVCHLRWWKTLFREGEIGFSFRVGLTDLLTLVIAKQARSPSRAIRSGKRACPALNLISWEKYPRNRYDETQQHQSGQTSRVHLQVDTNI